MEYSMKFDLIQTDSGSRANRKPNISILCHRKPRNHKLQAFTIITSKWHFSDKNSAITRRGIKISKNGLHPRIRRTILHRHTNFQPNLSHSGNHLFPVDTLGRRYLLSIQSRIIINSI